MDMQATLTSSLVTIRPLHSNDFEALYAVAKDPLIWEQHPATDRYQKDVFTKLFEESIASKGALFIIDNQTDKCIGSSRYKANVNAANSIEIGWTFLARAYWGGDYNVNIKSLMIDHAFNYVDIVLLHIAKNNVRSIKAVEKLKAAQSVVEADTHLVSSNPNNITYRIDKQNWYAK